jgi:hypothetical protein
VIFAPLGPCSPAPSFPAGQGTTPIQTFTEEFTVDQEGLTIFEGPNVLGSLAPISLSYTRHTSLNLSPGQKIFLALAFDVIVPLGQNATVTYSPTVLPDATLIHTSASCKNDTGADIDCDSTDPSLSLKIDPVPAPLAVGGLPLMAHASRRLRQRIRRANQGGRPQPVDPGPDLQRRPPASPGICRVPRTGSRLGFRGLVKARPS